MHKKTIIFILALLFMILIRFIPIADSWGLSNDGKMGLSILAFVIVLWMTEAVPFPVTGLILMITIPLFGLASFGQVVNDGFGNPIVVFFIGIMAISAALSETGLTHRFTLLVLHIAGTKTSTIILLFLVMGSFLSMWITNMGVAAILYPVAMTILKNCNRKPLESNFGRALMISIPWGCGIGGMGTPVGNGANVLAVGYLQEIAGISITFFDWMKVGVPAILMALPVSWFLLLKIFPLEIDRLPIAKGFVGEELKKLGPMTPKEKITLLIFSLAIFLWLFSPFLETWYGIRVPIQGVAVFAAVLLFLPGLGVMGWNDAQRVIDWGAIVLIAGGISLGQVLFSTGSAHWIARTFLLQIGTLGLLGRYLLIVSLVIFLKLFIASNTAAGLVIIPIMISLATELGMNVWLVTGPAALAISLAFLTIPSSPTNVISYAGGFFSIKDFSLSGICMSIGGILAITISFLLIY